MHYKSPEFSLQKPYLEWAFCGKVINIIKNPNSLTNIKYNVSCESCCKKMLRIGIIDEHPKLVQRTA